jgi:hypothetical protein
VAGDGFERVVRLTVVDCDFVLLGIHTSSCVFLDWIVR